LEKIGKNSFVKIKNKGNTAAGGVGEWGESLGQTLKNKNKIFYICNSSS